MYCIEATVTYLLPHPQTELITSFLRSDSGPTKRLGSNISGFGNITGSRKINLLIRYKWAANNEYQMGFTIH